VTKEIASAARFGAYIKALREGAGLSLRAAAPRVGLSFPHLGRIERGELRSPPTPELLRRLALGYQCPLRTLVVAVGGSYSLDEGDEYTNLESRFLCLMASAECGFSGFDTVHVGLIGPSLQAQILEFARKIERHTEARLGVAGEGGAPLRSLDEIEGTGGFRITFDNWDVGK
jgi:transcriptional regulator with XRE-family HTH domain